MTTKPKKSAAPAAELPNAPITAAGNGQLAKAPQVEAGGAGKKERQWWFDARGMKGNEADILDAAYQSNCFAILMKPDQIDQIMTGKQKVVEIEDEKELAGLPSNVWIYASDDRLVEKARRSGRKAGMFVSVKDLESEFPHCVKICKRGYDFVVIDIHNATYIPYELLLAETEALPTRVLRSVPIVGLQGTVDEVNQALNAFGTMEAGVDVVFRSRSSKDIKEYSAGIEQRLRGTIKLVEAEVIEVQHTGLGHRVCVDTTTLMNDQEGMIVGSTGWGGIFVCSETHYLPHMNLREFRCNAGGVHSYVWGPDNVAVYLSELRAGSEVLCVDIHGKTRVVTVGRVKIERRPLLLIKSKVVQEDGKIALINTFLQNDWHVRIMGADGKVRNSTLVQPGERLLAYTDTPGRHTGIRVTENIVEN
ncbi:MAG: 3-dehydroquinate synthase II [Pirellulales bacterium]